MVDGPTEATDLDLTETNRALVRSFVAEALIRAQLEKLGHYIDDEHYTEHSPHIADGLPALRSALEASSDHGRTIHYERIHRVLAEGNFVLAVSEGAHAGVHSAYYDLFRVADGRIVEHWGTIEAIPPRSEWKNDNGKF